MAHSAQTAEGSLIIAPAIQRTRSVADRKLRRKTELSKALNKGALKLFDAIVVKLARRADLRTFDALATQNACCLAAKLAASIACACLLASLMMTCAVACASFSAALARWFFCSASARFCRTYCSSSSSMSVGRKWTTVCSSSSTSSMSCRSRTLNFGPPLRA